MTLNTIVTIVFIVLTLAVLVIGSYFYCRNKSLNDIRADVYQLFLEIEHNPNYTKAGKQKMKWVLSRARAYLPVWIQMFITEAFLEDVIEGWFIAAKDLLDDGKYNNSARK